MSTGITKEDLVEALEAVLKPRHAAINSDKHQAHHAFIDSFIERYQRKRALWDKIKLSMVGTGASAVVGGLIWLGTIVVQSISKHPPH